MLSTPTESAELGTCRPVSRSENSHITTGTMEGVDDFEGMIGSGGSFSMPSSPRADMEVCILTAPSNNISHQRHIHTTSTHNRTHIHASHSYLTCDSRDRTGMTSPPLSAEANRSYQRAPSITELDRLQRKRREERERSKANEDYYHQVDLVIDSVPSHQLQEFPIQEECPLKPSRRRYAGPPAPRLKIRPYRQRPRDAPVIIPSDAEILRPSLLTLFPSPDSDRFVLKFPNTQHGEMYLPDVELDTDASSPSMDLRSSMEEEEDRLLNVPVRNTVSKIRLQPKRRRTFSLEYAIPGQEYSSSSSSSPSTQGENESMDAARPFELPGSDSWREVRCRGPLEPIQGDVHVPLPHNHSDSTSNPILDLMPFPSPPRGYLQHQEPFNLQPKKPRLIEQKELDMLMELNVSSSQERLKAPQEAYSMEMAKEAAFRFGRSESVEGIQQALSPSQWSESNFRTPNCKSRKVLNMKNSEERGGLFLPGLFPSTSEDDLSSYTSQFQRSSSILSFLKDRFSPSKSKFKTPSRS